MYKYWILISFLAMLTTSIGVIALKLIDQSKYDNNIFLALTFIFMGLISMIYLMFNKNSKNLLNNCDKNLIIFVIGFAILLILNNYIIQKAFIISPNIAYSHIIINLNIILSLFSGYYLFKQNIDFKCFIGILISLIGISIIAIYSNT